MSEILSATFPPVSALTPDLLQSTRRRVVANQQPLLPGVDLRPGSPTGDLSVTADTYRIAAAEASVTATLGDIDLSLVAAGIIHDCDFVNAYMQNLGVVDRPNASSTGTIRMLFDKPTLDAYFVANDYAPLLVNRGLQFKFGDADVFRMRLASDLTNLQLIHPSQPVIQRGARGLAVQDANTYVVDIPVVGTLTDDVGAGAVASLDGVVTGLTSALALEDFHPGNPELTVALRAQMALSLFHASSLATRGGTVGFVLRNYPDVVDCSPVISGDMEMTRDQANLLGVSDGRMDVFVHSRSGLLQDTISVDLPYVTDNGKIRFIGPVVFPSPPVFIDTLVAADAPALPLWNPGTTPLPTPSLISYSSNPKKGVMGGVARSAYERFVLAVDQQFDGLDPQIPVRVENGVQVGRFSITYRLDPSVLGVHELVSDPKQAYVGVDVVTKAFVPIVFSALNVQYFRNTGTTINIGLARSDLLNALRSVSYPDVLTLSPFTDSLLYAGASAVKGIVAGAAARQSAATYYLRPGKLPPTTNAELDALNLSGLTAIPVDTLSDTVLSTLTAEGAPVYGLSIGDNVVTDIATLRPKMSDPSRYMAYGPRNLAYVIDDAALNFSEVGI